MPRMSHRIHAAAIAFALAGLVFTGVARADSEYERRTLAGLRGVHVVVHQPDPEAAENGLTLDALRLDVEEPLRAAGIAFLAEEESRATPGIPWLQLLVTLAKVEKKNLYAWSLRLVLLQRACMERDPKICESCATWEVTRFGTVGSFQQKKIRADVRELAQKFADAYWTVNTR